MIKKINVKGFDCHIAINQASETITYLLYPALVPFKDEWLLRMSNELGVTLAAVYVPADDWNDVLTPWPEPGEAKGCPPFAGKSAEFLKLLQGEIIPAVDKVVGFEAGVMRDLMGVSLGGLFTLWEWMICDTFRSIACLSGSFWYNGFIDWFDKQPVPKKSGKAYFLLGEEEPEAHVKAFRSVGVNTEAVVSRLKESGINVEFEWVPGNHFSEPVHRAERALRGLYSK